MTQKSEPTSGTGLRFGLVIPFNYLLPILGFSLVYSFSVLRMLGYSLEIFYQGVFGFIWIVFFRLTFIYPKKVFLGLLALGILGGLVVSLVYVQSAEFRLGLGQWLGREFILIQPDALIIPLVILGAVTLLGFSMVFVPGPGISLLPLVGWLGLVILGLQSESIYLLPVDIPMGLLSPGTIFFLLLGSMVSWYLLVGLRKMIQLPQELHPSHQGFLWSTLTVAMILALVLPTNLPPLQLPAMPQFSFFNTGTVLGDFGRSTSRGRGYSYDRQFIYYFAGEAQGNRLGGDLVQTPTVLVEVDGLSEFYLRAIAHDTYTGFSWATSQEPWPMIEFPAPPSQLRPFLAQGQFTLIPRAIETRSVFTQGFPTQIRGLLFPLQIDETDSFSQPLLISSGSTYGVTSQLITHRERLSRTLLTLEPQSISQNFPAGMEQFLQLPEGFPQRVTELSRTITQDHDHPYAQVTALVTYLRDTFSYSETFPRLPADQDFVDHFLFEYQQGYCTAFASALALMARTLGIPTRYVVGFRVPPSQPGRTLVQVTGFHAHTWVEAYIPGVGWLAFEPTPGFNLPELSSTDPRLTPVNLGNELDDTLDSLQDQTPELLSTLESDEPATIQIFGYTLELDRVISTLKVLIIIGLVGFLGMFFFRILTRHRVVTRNLSSLIQGFIQQPLVPDFNDDPKSQQTLQQNQDQEESVHRVSRAMKAALEYLGPFGFGLQPGETLTTYGRRTHRDLGFTQDFDLLELTHQLDKHLYGDSYEPRSLDSEALNHQLSLFLLFALRKYKKERSLYQRWLDLILPNRLLDRVYHLLIKG